MEKQTRRNKILLISALAMVSQVSIAGTCAMKTQMTNTAQQELQRRQSVTNNNQGQLELLNSLQQACLENFPDIPTEGLGGSAILTAALNKVKQKACKAMADKARQTAQDAIAQAKAAVQQQIDGMQTAVNNGTNSNIGNQIGDLVTGPTPSTSTGSGAGNTVPGAGSSGGSMLDNVTSALSRMFK